MSTAEELKPGLLVGEIHTHFGITNVFYVGCCIARVEENIVCFLTQTQEKEMFLLHVKIYYIICD